MGLEIGEDCQLQEHPAIEYLTQQILYDACKHGKIDFKSTMVMMLTDFIFKPING